VHVVAVGVVLYCGYAVIAVEYSVAVYAFFAVVVVVCFMLTVSVGVGVVAGGAVVVVDVVADVVCVYGVGVAFVMPGWLV